MHDLICYKTMPVWNKDSVPQGFLQQHNTKVGTWAKLTVLKGEVYFAMLSEQGDIQSEHTFTVDNQPPFIQPQAWHKIVSLSDDAECQLAFYCQPQDYFNKKYQLTPTHSEILEIAPKLPVGKALDIGCGRGRNALYLSQKGFSVDAWDSNAQGLAELHEVMAKENIQNIQTQQVDLNQQQQINQSYDFIFSTVVFMFLQPATIPALIAQMKQATRRGGYNLIVCAMDSQDYPNRLMNFPFLFKTGELKAYYQGWRIEKYNEDVGELHRVDENGNRIQLRFATLVAQKTD